MNQRLDLYDETIHGDEIRIDIVAVCYRLHPRAFAKKLFAIVKSSGYRTSVTVVCNNPAVELPENLPRTRFVRGSNRYLDWSGYIEGLSELPGRSESDRRVVVFVNDTLFTKHPSKWILKLVLVGAEKLSQVCVPAIVGQAGRYQSGLMAGELSGSPLYVSSFCFALNEPAIGTIKEIYKPFEKTHIENVRHYFENEPKPRMREFIRLHLAEPDYAEIFARDETLYLAKALCVLWEQTLSDRIACDGLLFPINDTASVRLIGRFHKYFAKARRRLGRLWAKRES